VTSHPRDHFVICCREIHKTQYEIVFMHLSWTLVGSSHTFPSEDSPNHQPSSKDDEKTVDCKSNSGGEGKIVRIAPDPPQTCGTPNKCTDEDRCSNSSGLKDRPVHRYSLILSCIILYQNRTCILCPKRQEFLKKLFKINMFHRHANRSEHEIFCEVLFHQY
jgi:hypothetical protein